MKHTHTSRRIPGPPKPKFEALKKVNPTSFPYLIADILYYIYNHTDIKVVDGPGDGKRDIHSKLPESGELHITQCKFSKDINKTLSSSDTDQLIIALQKFGAKKGMLATTGKISPQAKREYISDYPGFGLEFLEGSDVIDRLHTSPVIMECWMKNDSIAKSYNDIVIPVIIRDIENDEDISPLDDRWKLLDNEKFVKFEETISKDRFFPFRGPSEISMGHHDQVIYCTLLLPKGIKYIHDIPSVLDGIYKQIGKCFSKTLPLYAIRIGQPAIANILKNNILESVTLNEKIAATIISHKGVRFSEKEWMLPNLSDLIFPYDLRSLQASWAAWLNRKYDYLVSLVLAQPHDLSNNPVRALQNKIRLEKINISLFIAVRKKEFDDDFNLFKDEVTPNWICDYGIDDLIIGWVHPFVYTNGYTHLKIKNKKPVYDDPSIELTFEKVKEKVRVLLSKEKYREISPDKAIAYSSVHEKALMPKYEVDLYDSAYLYHYFEDLRSPIFLKNRQLNFTKIWKLGNAKRKSTSDQLIKKVVSSSQFIRTDFEIITGTNELRYGKCDLICNIPIHLTTSSFLPAQILTAKYVFEQFERRVVELFPGSSSATEKYWFDEIGIYYK